MAKWKTWDEYLAHLSNEEREAIDLRLALTDVMTDSTDADDDSIFGADLERVLKLLHKYGKTLAIVPIKDAENV